MKKLACIVMAVTAMLTAGCSSDDGGSTNDEMYIKWTVNGETYNIEDPATMSSLSTAITAQEGMDANFRSMTLWMPNDATEGTHPIVTNNGSQTDVYSAVFDLGDISADSTTGTITIQSIDEEYIKGTFSFTATDSEGETYTVTNGSFRAYSPSEPGN